MGLLARALEGRTQLSTLRQPASWLLEAFGALPSAAGKTVSAETARTIPAVFAAMRCIAEDVATLPFRVYRRHDDETRTADRTHPTHAILNVRANPRQTACECREVLMWHALLRGNAYAEIQRTGGRITGLLPFHPDRIERLLAPDDRLWYRYQNPQTGAEIVYADEEILHLSGPGDDGYGGLSLVQLFRTALGMAIAAEEYAARFFANNASPGGALEHPAKLTKDAHSKLKDSWAARHQGPENAHRLAIFEEGMKYVQLGFTNKDAQFLESRQFQVVEIARVFRIPPHKLQDESRSTFSNIEHRAIEYVVDTLRPWCTRWEQRVLLALFTEKERQLGYYAEHVMDALLRGDQKSRYDSYAIGIQNAFLSPNDVARMENRPPIAGGDLYLAPLNMVPLNQVGTVPGGGGAQPTAGSGTPNNGGRRALDLTTGGLLGDAWGRIERRRTTGGLAGLGDYADRVLAPLLDAYGVGLRSLGAPGGHDFKALRRSLVADYLEQVEGGAVDVAGLTATALAGVQLFTGAAPAA